jgi:hypothetical protein
MKIQTPDIKVSTNMYEKIREMKAFEIHGDKKKVFFAASPPGHAGINAAFWQG